MQGFVPDELKPSALVTVIAQGPGADEEAGRRYLGGNQWEPHPHAPLIGKTGRVFERTFLPLAGLDRSEVSLGNIVRCRWNHKDTLPPLNQKVVQAAIAHCSRAHLRIPESTKVVVAMGEYAFYGLTGLLHDFNGWRGYLAPLSLPGEPRVPMTGVWTPGRTPGDRLPVFVTYHIARLFREPEAELPTKRDWNKLAYILAGKWPEPMPPIIGEPLDVWPTEFAFDTEFELSNVVYSKGENLQGVSGTIRNTRLQVSQMLCSLQPDKAIFLSSLALEAKWDAVRALLSSGEGPDRIDLAAEEAWNDIRRVCQEASPTKGEVRYLRKTASGATPPGISPGSGSLSSNVEVSRAALSVVQRWARSLSRVERGPETSHPISRLVRYSMATRDRRVWVIEAANADRGTILPGSVAIMHNAPADLPHLRRFFGLTVEELLALIEIEDTMYAHAVLWTGRVETDDQKGKQGSASSHTLNFLGSIYARINRWKHLARIAPRQYAGADALGTMDAWATGLHGGLLGELDRDPQTKWVYENLQKPLIPIIMKAHQRGIATDREAARAALVDIKREQDRFELRAQAYAGWPLNLRSPQHVAFWLFDVEGLKVRRKFGAR